MRAISVLLSALVLLAEPARAADSEGDDGLLRAVRAGNPRRVERLLREGAPADVRGPGGETPLLAAARAGDEASVFLLLARGADVRAADDQGTTVLHGAAAAGNRRLFFALLTRGADPLAANREGRFPTPPPARSAERRVVEQIARRPAPPPTAAGEGAMERIARLRASPLSGDPWTEALRAAGRGDGAAVEAYLDAGGDPNGPRNGRGSLLAEAAARGNEELVALLLDRGALVTAAGEDQGALSALYVAARAGHAAVVRRLLGAGASPLGPPSDARSARSPLAAAAAAGSPEVVDLLLGAGAEPRKEEGRAALVAAGGRPPAAEVRQVAYRVEVHSQVTRAWAPPSDLRGRLLDVWLEVTVDAGGRVTESRVARSSGEERFDQAALDAVRRAGPLPPPPGGAGLELGFRFSQPNGRPRIESALPPPPRGGPSGAEEAR